MGSLRVDFAALQSRADGLTDMINATQALLEQLEQDLASALSSWTGDAHDAFTKRYNNWLAAAKELHDDLPRIRDFVVTAHGNHARALSVNLDIWRV